MLRRNSNADMYGLGLFHSESLRLSVISHGRRAMSPEISVIARYIGV